MEQKRTLWIVISSGVFLMVVIGAALLLYAPEAKRNTSATYQREIGNVWMSPSYTEPSSETEKVADFTSVSTPNGYAYDSSSIDPANVNTTSVISALDTPAEGQTNLTEPSHASASVPSELTAENVTVIAKGQTSVYGMGTLSENSASNTTTIDVGNVNVYTGESNVTAQNKAAEDKMRETSERHKVAENPSKEIYVEPATVRSVSVSSNKSYSESEPKVAQKKSEPEKQKKPEPAKKPAPAPKTASASSSTAQKAAPAAKPSTRVPDRYWVQAASYSSKKSADEARDLLDSKQIQCEVFTFTDAKGSLFYRVRVGPYTTKNEAEYWKKRIDEIAAFAKNNTYVTNSSAAVAKK